MTALPLALRLVPVVGRRAGLVALAWLAAGLLALTLLPPSVTLQAGTTGPALGPLVLLAIAGAAIARRTCVEDIRRGERPYLDALAVTRGHAAAVRLGTGAALVLALWTGVGLATRLGLREVAQRVYGGESLAVVPETAAPAALGCALLAYAATAFIVAWSARDEWLAQGGVAGFVVAIVLPAVAGERLGLPFLPAALGAAAVLLLAAAYAIAHKEALPPPGLGGMGRAGRVALFALAMALGLGLPADVVIDAARWVAPFTPWPAVTAAAATIAVLALALALGLRVYRRGWPRGLRAVAAASPWGLLGLAFAISLIVPLALGWVRLFRVVTIRASLPGVHVVVDGRDLGEAPVTLRGVRFADLGGWFGTVVRSDAMDVAAEALAAAGSTLPTTLGAREVRLELGGIPLAPHHASVHRTERAFAIEDEAFLVVQAAFVERDVAVVAARVRERGGAFDAGDVGALARYGEAAFAYLNERVRSDPDALGALLDAVVREVHGIDVDADASARRALAERLLGRIEARFRRGRGWSADSDGALDLLRAFALVGGEAAPVVLARYDELPIAPAILGAIGDTRAVPRLLAEARLELARKGFPAPEVEALGRIDTDEAFAFLLDLHARTLERAAEAGDDDAMHRFWNPLHVAEALALTGRAEAFAAVRGVVEEIYLAEQERRVPSFERAVDGYLRGLGTPGAEALRARLTAR